MDQKLLLLCVYSVVPLCYAMEQEVVKSKKIGIFSEINTRKEQQDRFYHDIVDGGNLYAVYDGHLGSEVADFLAKNFHEYFRKTSGSIKERMSKAFRNADNAQFIKDKKHCGAAAVVVFIKNNVAHFAHVGDSRAVLEYRGQVAFATKDHRPDRADEYIRIEDKKGVEFVEMMKDFLILSRSFGDHGVNKDIIISEPDYAEVELTDKHKFLILASDGLWGCMCNEDAVSMLHEKSSQLSDVKLLANMLGAVAMKKSLDNITVMVVDLLS